VPAQPPTILILPLGRLETLVLCVVAGYIQGILKVPVDIGETVEVPQETYIPDRHQYDAGLLICFLREFALSYRCVLGITSVDITLPIFTHVFGEAELGGHAALVSTYRLGKDTHGRRVTDAVFYERVAKVVLHEIGHVFSLYHCGDGKCVMRFSAKLDGLDEIPLYFCDRCYFLLRRMIFRNRAGEGT